MKKEWKLKHFVVALFVAGFMVWAANQLRETTGTNRSPSETNEGKSRDPTCNFPGGFAEKRARSQPPPAVEEEIRVFLRVAQEGGKYKQISPEGVVTWIDPNASPPPTPTGSAVIIHVGPLNLTDEEMDEIGFPWEKLKDEEKKGEAGK